jgi:C-terminal processing protease CtpA/Prc
LLPLSATLALAVPYARSINPVTGTNWEAVGVEPDVAVPAEQAFDHAYRLALEHVQRTTTSPIVRTQAEEALAGSSHGPASGNDAPIARQVISGCCCRSR